MKDIRAAVDEKVQWRHSELLLLNKTKCLATLEALETMFVNSIAGLQFVGHRLMIQHDNMTNGGSVDPQKQNHPPSVLLAANHARRLTKQNYTSRFNMTKDQTRLLDTFDCASCMLEASSEFLGLQTRCRELIALVQAESDLQASLQSRRGPTKGVLDEARKMLGIAYERVLWAVALIAGNTIGSSILVSNTGCLGRPSITAPVALDAEVEWTACLNNSDDDQLCVDEHEDNGLLEVY
ncbi:hypothetical protein QM012_009051 [Aureobasidium pullulans]|uniref:Prion-inhibition and propagation HeLo domain-containing protein n=1 Tax=Aureobasidium pullulans TaxID=5580 RepID=A0ABR0TID1_AURPU